MPPHRKINRKSQKLKIKYYEGDKCEKIKGEVQLLEESSRPTQKIQKNEN